MSRVNIEDNNLVITMQGVRKVLTLKSELSIPLANIVSVETCPSDERQNVFFKGWRVGTEVGFYSGGTFYKSGNKAFYDLKRKEDAVIITLKDEDFDTLIIGVDDPQATAELIEEAIKTLK